MSLSRNATTSPNTDTRCREIHSPPAFEQYLRLTVSVLQAVVAQRINATGKSPRTRASSFARDDPMACPRPSNMTWVSPASSPVPRNRLQLLSSPVFGPVKIVNVANCAPMRMGMPASAGSTMDEVSQRNFEWVPASMITCASSALDQTRMVSALQPKTCFPSRAFSIKHALISFWLIRFRQRYQRK